MTREPQVHKGFTRTRMITMESTERLMNRVRERMAENSEREQDLHEEALELDLHPQPWWNREFYEHAIHMREVELETGGGEKEDE